MVIAGGGTRDAGGRGRRGACLAAALALALAGCDYWSNLGRDIRADSGEARLEVLDTLYGGEVTSVEVILPDGTRVPYTDGGVLSLPNLPAGPNAIGIHSLDSAYLDKQAVLKVKPGPQTAVEAIYLLRRPGAGTWYPSRDRQVAFTWNRPLRAPGTITFHATPVESAAVHRAYRYYWRFSDGFSAAQTGAGADSLVRTFGGPQNDSLTLTVTVWRGSSEDTVGTVRSPLRIAANHPPVVRDFNFITGSGNDTLIAGCADLDSFQVAYSVADPDSAAVDSVRIRTLDTNAYIYLNAAKPASYGIRRLSFPITDTFHADPGDILRDSTRLEIRAWDDNGETSKPDTQRIQLRNNPAPTAKINLSTPFFIYFTHENVWTNLQVFKPSPGWLDSATVDWGDGNTTSIAFPPGASSYTPTVTHAYGTTGQKKIRLTAFDQCGTPGESIAKIEVQDNHPPQMEFDPVFSRFDSAGAFELFLRAWDQDQHTTYRDKVSQVQVRWGDGSPPSRYLPSDNTDFSVFNAYPHRYADSTAFPLQIVVTVTDEYNNSTTDSLPVPSRR